MSSSGSPDPSLLDENVKPGEYVLQTLFLEFCNLSEKKIELVLAEPLEKLLTKSLQKGDDQQFDQLLNALGNVAEQSLPSLLQSLFRWYERQLMLDEGGHAEPRLRHRSKGSKDYLCERRDLAVEFVYCLVLVEVLTKLSYHPGHDDLVGKIISQAFKHFKYKDGFSDTDKRLQTNPNAANINIIADLYAEVIGVLALSRFAPVRKTFLLELRELKLRDQTPYTAQSIISLLMGLKFFRVKMHPIEDFEQCVQFLHELGHYFLDVKDRDIKHALASLFVEILLPVASTAKHEVNVPVLKNLVEMMYTPCVDLTMKRKHSQSMFPLVTCMLCVSQKPFFLNNWPYFLTNCLSQLKNRDPKLSRVALESLSRLVWVYMVRIKCESNQVTTSRLQSVISSLFPKGQKVVTPKDMPLNIFVKIIQFIATERLDFAMKEIIFDLLSVGKKSNFLTPERMSIGLRAFLVVADSLQQCDGDPPMPQSNTVYPSGATVRVKKTFLNKMLTEDMAKHIGLSQYVPYLLKTFDSMLRTLDLNVGRPLLLTKPENVNKEPEEVITGEKKPKMDLFRTCIAAIPRLIPDGLSKSELVELVTRLTVHFDEELRGLAFQALQNLMQESDVWKEHVVRGFVQFIQKEISDTNIQQSQQLDSALRLLMQLISKYNIQKYVGISGSLLALHEVEGLALVMLCNHRVVTRKLAAHLLKEVKQIFSSVPALSSEHVVCTSLLEAMDQACPAVIERLLPSLVPSERTFILNCSSVDLQWLLERSATVWSSSHDDKEEPRSESNFSKVDPWMQCIAMFVSKDFAMTSCQLAIAHAWPIVYTRLNALYTLLDPGNMINENRASSFIRSGSKKAPTEKDHHMQLWQNYVILACSVAQNTPITDIVNRIVLPEPSTLTEEKADKNSNVCSMFKQLVPLIRCESADMRDTIVNGLGYTNPVVFKELMEELVPLLKEAIERKAENIKRRRKRDVFRVQLAHIFELMAEHKTFAQSESAVIDDNHCLTKPFVEYIDGARIYLEGESDRDLPTLQDIRLHFSKFVRHLICNTPVEYKPSLLTRELRYSLFDLFASWSGKFSHTSSAIDRRLTKDDGCTELELAAVRAMSAVVCCGPVFDTNGINDDGYIYHWLDTLLSSHDDRDRTLRSKIYELAKETVVLLLDFNSDNQGLLDWVIDRCYTGTNEVSDGCFNALAAVFQAREYPCDHVAMLNLAILNVGNPRMPTHETAVQLLHLLDRRFFQEESVLRDNSEQHQPLNDVFLSVSYCKSQMFMSDQLARLHPDLTMPIFSEITHRFQTAKPAVRQTLLKYLLPWLHNMELVDPSLPQSNPLSTFLVRLHDNYTETFKPPLKGEGWGSQEATKMVLNNLFYITVKFGDDHPQELEALWAALVLCWPNNIRVVMHYLVILINMAATELLSHAKRVVGYIGRARPERLVDELMAELQTVETLNLNIERTQTPPFFRLSVIRRPTIVPNTTDDEKLESHVANLALEKGTLHTKRHSANPDDVLSETTPRTDSAQESDSSLESEDEMSLPSPIRGSSEQRRNEANAPYPLPMPAYGGYFAPLSEYLPDSLHPSAGFHRSNIAIMVMSDLVLDGLEIDWSAHLPLMLHVIFLGLDHNKELVYEHCKKLLLNLMLLAANQDCPEVARLLLSYQTNLDDTLQLINESKDSTTSEHNNSSTEEPHEPRPIFRVDSSTTLMPGTPGTPPTPEQPSTESVTESTDPDTLNSVLDIVKVVLEIMSKRRGRPLWCYEDITPKTLVTQSAEQLENLLRFIVKFFKYLSPLALVEQRWSQVAMQLALSCSSRHYAGRSFQVLRALHIRPSSQMLADILSRLVETVAEQGEDMQGYVTEIILTLEAVVDNVDLEIRPIDFMRDIFMSTPNLAQSQVGAESRRGVLMAPKQQPYQQQHMRSISYAVQGVASKVSGITDARNRSGTDLEMRLKSNVPRSRSEKTLKNSEQGMEDKLTIMTQMFWIAVSLLESDYEYEFLLATKLLDKILQHLQPDRPDCREKLEKIQQQIKWTNFPGVQTLLLKGCTSQITAECTWQLLTRLTVCINSSVVDPTGSHGFPMNVIALLPYLVHHYENPSQLCRDSADHISQICAQKSDRLNNLGTVMSLYSRGTFGKDSFQWTKCVVKYLHDVYVQASVSMVSFLVEVLEKGPHSYQLAVLQILHCMVHYIDLNTQPSVVLNQELFYTVSKHVQGPHWKEAIKILKLAVARSSTLTAAASSTSEQTYALHRSLAEIDVLHKKELPGRTLDFSVDLSSTSIIGRKYLNQELHGTPHSDATTPSNQSSLSRKGSGNEADTCWKKPQNSQARTRERLTELLACYGQKRLPKSPSVIFSQSSDTLDHQQSIASSGEDSIPDIAQSSDGIYSVDSNGLDMVKMTIKNFDFLGEYEAEYDYQTNLHDNDYFTSFDHSRRQSLNDSPDPDHSRHRSSQFGSTPDLNLIGKLSLTEIPGHGVSTESINIDRETLSGRESVSSTPEEPHHRSVTPCASSVIVIQNPGLMEEQENSPLTESVHSVDSICSDDPDLVDLGASASSVTFPNFLISYVYLMNQGEEVDEMWKQHVSKVISESSVTNTVYTSQIFPRLYRELRRRLATLTKDAVYYISKTEGLKNIGAQLLQTLDTMFTHLECPYFFIETDVLVGSRVVDRHKYCLLEMQECFETYCTTKDQAEQSLEEIKVSIKQQSLGDGGSFPIKCSDEQKLDLCQKLYKLIFQLVMLFESFIKLLDCFKLVQTASQVNDISGQVENIKGEVTAAMSELENGQASPLNVDSPKTITKQDAFSSLSEYIKSQQYQKAVQLVRSFRTMWPGDMFGQTQDDDVVTLLNVFCIEMAEKKTGVFVLTKVEFDIGLLYSQLLDINQQIRNWTIPSPQQSCAESNELDLLDSSTL
ncbi:protein furry-like isoform X2 [Mercenaria mercenaria]|uniref:protein furry-like isoform X2 n=1 Tax=Mercenaria mercenaria TaxID=6596 RepID=UPI00234E9E47|nr:protein furry-like isoform X2 [Mercenaria mercenaria]